MNCYVGTPLSDTFNGSGGEGVTNQKRKLKEDDGANKTFHSIGSHFLHEKSRIWVNTRILTKQYILLLSNVYSFFSLQKGINF